MKFLVISIFIMSGISFSTTGGNTAQRESASDFSDTIPFVLGNFTDDYGIQYTINDTLWVQHPSIRYHIIRWNKKEHYFIAKNDDKNPTEPGLYTRIDYMQFENMKPYLWGFCLTVYDAQNDSIAEFSVKPDRINPKKGCNGYPFSRMRKPEQ